ncbi:recombinase family protein, partial [uncultured Rhodoblastus sp.]|uniref:recombinase family protein n=1 Tax=uncultured Rhodoblastus sp. TaxID=543037 RepID=UPI0025EAF940
MFVRAYLRASTSDQDANRAREQLEAFAVERGLKIAAWYVENESGAKLARPELFRLLNDACPGDLILCEQVDRLSRLSSSDWEKLKTEIAARRVRVVALDLPTSWVMAAEKTYPFGGGRLPLRSDLAERSLLRALIRARLRVAHGPFHFADRSRSSPLMVR